MWARMNKLKTFSSVELGDWTVGEQSIVYVRLLLWGIWTRSRSSKCRRPRTGLSIGLVHPDPRNLWTRSPLFHELSIHAQPSTLGTVIYNFLPSNDRRKPCLSLTPQVIFTFQCLFCSFSLHLPSFFCASQQIPFSHLSIFTICLFIPLPLTTPVFLSFVPPDFSKGDQWSLEAFLPGSLLSRSGTRSLFL